MKAITSLWLILTFFFGSFRFGFVPTAVVDLKAARGEISSAASGCLYGLAEANVPSETMVKSLGVSVLTQKVPDGLQHPTGDLAHVQQTADGETRLVVYLQDAYSTWYYDHAAIFSAREAGTYAPDEYLRSDFFPKVTQAVETVAAADYGDRVIYCPFNECDNGIWFGEWVQGDNGPYAAFNETGRRTFYRAWKATYDLIRALQPDAQIGGPGYYEYNAEKEADFLRFCKENDCVPDVMIYHELNDLSSLWWTEHVNEYRALEESLGIAPLPIIVTEYGTMAECGNPAAMLRYIAAMEESGTAGCIAYWRLANNLNDNAADDNMPNSCWWLYRWYAAMSGAFVPAKTEDLFHADFGKAVKEGRQMKVKTFASFASFDRQKRTVEVLLTARYGVDVAIRHLREAGITGKAHVRVEVVQYQGLGGAVAAPVLLSDHDAPIAGDRLKIKVPDAQSDAVCRVTVTPATGTALPTAALPVRYECEEGTRLGKSYTYRSAYASTGNEEGLVGGFEAPGDGLTMTVNTPAAGDYDLTVIYGKGNDGPTPADRRSAKAALEINGAQQTVLLPNTIKSEYTGSIKLTLPLKKGANRLRFFHQDGTFVLDSLLLAPHKEEAAPTLLPAADFAGENETAFLAIAPENGAYALQTAARSVYLDGVPCSGRTLCLKRGLNVITLAGSDQTAALSPALSAAPLKRLSPADMTLSGTAAITNGALSGVTADSGSANTTFFVPTDGTYRFIFSYANNQEGGYHDYNVDLIEAYYTVTVNGDDKTLMCRSTYSDETFSTVSLDVPLHAGENTLTLGNDGSIRFADRTPVSPLLRWIDVYPISE